MSDLPPPPPMRVEPLSYHTPMGTARPGILTALGIVSICIGAFSILANCGGMISAWAMTRPGMLAAMATPMPAPTTAPGAANPDSMSAAERQQVIRTFSQLTPLTPPRQQMLDQLLVEAGGAMFSFSLSSVSPATIRVAVTESGRLPSAGQRPGNDYFVLALGRVEIADDHAVFRPRTGEAIRVQAGEALAVEETAPPPAPPLGPVIAPAGAGALRDVFLLTFFEALFSMLMAVLLLVCGILVLMNSVRGRRWHRIWAYIKIPAAVLGSVIYWIQMTQTMNSFVLTPAAPARAFSTIMAVGAFIQFAIILSYPIAVLIVLRTRAVREFYESRLGQG